MTAVPPLLPAQIADMLEREMAFALTAENGLFHLATTVLDVFRGTDARPLAAANYILPNVKEGEGLAETAVVVKHVVNMLRNAHPTDTTCGAFAVFLALM